MGSRSKSWWLVWGLSVLMLLIGCSEGSAPTAPQVMLGSGQFGDECTQTEDCASGFCVRVEADRAICSQGCQADADCPTADNWACLSSSNEPGLQVCACRKFADRELCADLIDNDCDGNVDDCRVCNGVQVPNDDPSNCGACGVRCRADQSCNNGSCSCTDAMAVECGGVCTLTTSDVANCGACGMACGTGQVCAAGTCDCPSADTPDHCPGVGCVAQQSDADNCGACGNVCTLARVCEAGSCVCPEGSPPDFCDAIGCLDLSTNLQNCGECGNACAADHVCIDGECVCPVGQTLCGGVCVDTQTNVAHCAGCDQSCSVAQACVGGECGCTSFGFTICGDDCANLLLDVQHCGTCDIACAPGERCAAGGCVCDSGLYCAEQCIAENDDANCGACGNACPLGQSCSSQTCVCDGFGLTPCGESCINASSDELNCGGCGQACRTGEVCTSGSCNCPAGQTYCDAAGSCVTLASDAVSSAPRK